MSKGQEAAVDQLEEAEPVSAEQDGGGATESIEVDAGVQSEGQDNADQEATLPPELQEQKKNLMRDYHAKTQALAEKERDMLSRAEEGERVSKTFQKLLNQDWFKKAYADFKSGRTAPLELTAEQLQNVTQDPRAFQELIDKRVEAIVQARYGEKLSQYEEEIGSLRSSSEVGALASRYPDFKEYHDNGSLKPYLREGHSMEGAYAMAKLKDEKPHKQVEKGVQERLQTMKNGAVGKRGVPSVSGGPVLKAKKGEDPWMVFDRMFEASLKNPDVRLERE